MTLHRSTVSNLAMLTVKHRPLTVHDYMRLPEDSGKKTELIEGDFFMPPSPKRPAGGPTSSEFG